MDFKIFLGHFLPSFDRTVYRDREAETERETRGMTCAKDRLGQELNWRSGPQAYANLRRPLSTPGSMLILPIFMSLCLKM